jgi:hypothetical protein
MQKDFAKRRPASIVEMRVGQSPVVGVVGNSRFLTGPSARFGMTKSAEPQF